MLSEEQKQHKLCSLSTNKSLLLRPSGSISEKKIDWRQTLLTKLIWKDSEWRTKTANTVPTAFEQKFAFKSFGLCFWEKIDWEQRIIIKMIGKDVEWRPKTANTVPTVFEQKFAFETFWLHFWENGWLISNNYDEFDWKRCWVNNKNRQYCAHCLRIKVRFWEFLSSFLREWLIDTKQ